MISLCVNLARKIGLRPTAATPKIVFDWLGVTNKLPKWTTIRTWMLRVGVAAIEQPIEEANDWAGVQVKPGRHRRANCVR